MIKITKLFLKLLDEGMVKSIFDHIRNLFYCTLILAAGFFVNANPPDWLTETSLSQISGYMIIGIAIMLMLLLFVDVMYKLSKLKHHVFLYIAIISFSRSLLHRYKAQ